MACLISYKLFSTVQTLWNVSYFDGLLIFKKFKVLLAQAPLSLTTMHPRPLWRMCFASIAVTTYDIFKILGIKMLEHQL